MIVPKYLQYPITCIVGTKSLWVNIFWIKRNSVDIVLYFLYLEYVCTKTFGPNWRCIHVFLYFILKYDWN